jgi:tetratricopeptide (TPR) repeat protein
VKSHLIPFLILAALATSTAGATVGWTAKDTAGRDVAVPMADKPVVVAFLRPGQQQSDDALEQMKAVLAKQPAGQIVLVFSGPDNAAAGHQYAAARMITWPVVLDRDYALSGKMNVHVWPATIVVGTDGTEIARLTGMPSSYAADLHANLDFAARQIDQAALNRRLSTKQVVAATSQQAATRYVIIANALLDRGQVDAALVEIEQGLTRDPSDASLRLTRARILLKQKKFADALAAADQLAGVIPAWQCNVVRGEALIALERWPEAKAAVADAVKLNPSPSHAWYLAGLVHAHDQDWKNASAAFQRAYESTLGGGAKAAR